MPEGRILYQGNISGQHHEFVGLDGRLSIFLLFEHVLVNTDVLLNTIFKRYLLPVIEQQDVEVCFGESVELFTHLPSNPERSLSHLPRLRAPDNATISSVIESHSVKDVYYVAWTLRAVR